MIALFGRAGGAPFGGAEEMVRDFKAKVFSGEPVKFVALGQDGKPGVRTA